jgi:hypothetical protein
VILTLPTGFFIIGAALTVAMTALIMISTRWLPRLDASQAYTGRERFPFMATSYLSFIALCALILLGLYGPTDPMHNLLTLVFWTGLWIALPLAIMVFGNLWVGINPWTAPVRLTRTLLSRHRVLGLFLVSNRLYRARRPTGPCHTCHHLLADHLCDSGH